MILYLCSLLYVYLFMTACGGDATGLQDAPVVVVHMEIKDHVISSQEGGTLVISPSSSDNNLKSWIEVLDRSNLLETGTIVFKDTVDSSVLASLNLDSTNVDAASIALGTHPLDDAELPRLTIDINDDKYEAIKQILLESSKASSISTIIDSESLIPPTEAFPGWPAKGKSYLLTNTTGTPFIFTGVLQ